jgi:hypothetical protein
MEGSGKGFVQGGVGFVGEEKFFGRGAELEESDFGKEREVGLDLRGKVRWRGRLGAGVGVGVGLVGTVRILVAFSMAKALGEGCGGVAQMKGDGKGAGALDGGLG